MIFVEDHRVGSSRAADRERNDPKRLFRETTERSEVHPTPSAEVVCCPFRGTKGRGRVAEWLKAHD